MANLRLNSSGGGYVEIAPPATASQITLTVPANNATLFTTAGGAITGNVSFANAVTFSSNNVTIGGNSISPAVGMRNRIINGDMRIDQRNVGASVTPGDGTYTLDRWVGYRSQASKYSIQQNAGSVTPPAGFVNYLGVTSLSSYSSISTDYFGLAQFIEGLNISDLAWGTSNAKPITISFWVRSSLTGLFPVQVANSATNRTYFSNFTINSANTWEYKTITIPGDTTGTWLTTNGVGIRLWFDLGSGTNIVGTENNWNTTGVAKTGSSVSIVGTNGATFYITGVQLEEGSNATPFERRPFGTELALCQRYYEKSYSIGTKPGTTIDGGQASFFIARDTFRCFGGTFYKVSKRGSPTVTIYSAYGVVGKTTQYEAPSDTGSGAFARRHEEYQINEIGDSSNPFTAGNYYWAAWTSSAEL